MGCSLGLISMFVLNIVVFCITLKQGNVPLWVYPLIFIGSFVLCWFIPNSIAAAIGEQQDEWEQHPKHGGLIGQIQRMFKRKD